LKRRRVLFRIAPVVLALLALAFVLGRGLLGPRDRIWARIQESGVWRVAMDPSFPPFENIDASGRIAGLDPDLAAAIAADWGVRLEIVSLGFDELMDAVAAEQVDTALSALPVVPHRTEELHFSQPYVDAGIVLAARSDGSVRSRSDLSGRRLAAEWGSAGDAEARALQEQLGGAVTLVLRDTMTAALDAVVNGEADAAAVDAITLALYSNRDRLLIDAGYLTREPYVAVVPAHAPDLLAALDASLRRLESNGTLDEIRGRWLRPGAG
jgi:ABC-type amino acid transport substrate-binding protein